ncbi:ABC transporter ATP-binding protein [Clostridium sp. D5]|uniref:ABC transporter ATP-binding protein n=1 Tax=Clostridium sp. D5 TaxID=556261 RepID=UPI0001FC8146|nr:ABC transporter ATP-binding protein [Clostridium sp. D5]EGB92638.1 ABC transporter, ATP-binding protein [Clostridium sp. D5]
MHHVTKTFGKVVANMDVDLELKNGEILALLGENGSGKTTLMNMLSGIYFPDHGEISIHGKQVTIRSPRDAFGLGIGMIHQHFKLVDVLTAAENIVLGLDGKATLNRKEVNKKVAEIASRYGFEIDPSKKIYNMAVSEKQTVEILKVLYRGADILILDEPTAVLTPQETEKLFAVLRNMKKDGKSIIIITHKLHEVLSISDRVAILRKGEYIGAVETDKTNQAELTEMMVGRPVSLEIERPQQERGIERLQVIDLTCLNGEGVKALDNVSFSAYGGEILGVAGIAGSGQKELCEAIAGLYPAIGGSVLYAGELNGEPIKERILGLKPDEIVKKGISMAFVPEDRLGMGLVAGMDMTDNVMLRSYKDKKGLFVDRKTPREVAEQLIEELEIVTPGVDTPVGRLSGGNVQKVLLGREIALSPSVLIVAYPVRGLDINSSYRIYDLLNEQKKKGVAVIFIGEDLDVLIELSDRLMVLCGGKVSGIVDPRTVTKEDIGLMMIHVEDEQISPEGGNEINGAGQGAGEKKDENPKEEAGV